MAYPTSQRCLVTGASLVDAFGDSCNHPEFSAIQNPGWFVFNLFPIETVGLVYLPSHLPQKSTKCR